MKPLLLIPLLGLFFLSQLKAQFPNQIILDSLAGELKAHSTADTTRIKLLLQFGQELVNIGVMDSARVLLDEALGIAEQTGSTLQKAKALTLYGVSYFYMGQTPEAQKYWEQALELANTVGNQPLITSLTVNMANAQMSQGNYPAALEMYLSALKHYESNKDQKGAALTYGNIGVLYGQMGDQDKAVDFLQKAFLIDSTNSYTDLMVSDLINLGNAYIMQKKFPEAESRLTYALKLARDNNNTPKIGQSLVMMANLNMEQFHLAEAIQYLGEANTFLRQIGDTYTLAINQGRMAVIYTDMVKPEHKAALDKYFGGNKQKALDAALAKMDSSMVVIKQVGDLSAEQIGYSTLTNIYELKGDYFNAFQNHIQYKVLSDSLLNMERDKKITQTAMQYEFDKKQAIDKAEQDKKDARQATIRNSIAGVLGGSLIFLFVVVRQRNRISQEKQRSEELLLNILPEEVAEELKAKGAADAKHFDRATILFTDFKNFTEMSEKMSPAELVEELNKCFKVFDELMVKYRIEKIKTIGDAYMAAGGLPDAQHGSPADVVRAALEMQSFMIRHRAEREAAGKPFFEMRLGIHTGPVVAGIVGVKKFQYDIWGDTVNMASRMESSGEVGHVNISEATYAEVKDTPGFVFTHRGMIHAKGKGEVDMWFVET